MMKNKEARIIIHVTKLGDQFCSTVEEIEDKILTENEVELKTMVRGMIAMMQNNPNDVYMEGIKAFAEDHKVCKKNKKVVETKDLKLN